MICLGTGITNSNADYPTETTLFQTKYNGGEQKVGNDGYWLHDGYDNYYHVVDGTVRSQIAEQESRHEKTRAVTKGKFSWGSATKCRIRIYGIDTAFCSGLGRPSENSCV